MSEEKRNTRKVVEGLVTSDKMGNTITVVSERKVMHPKYRKYIKKFSRYHAHDANEEAHIGDYVELTECRPLSKTKFFRLTRIVRRGKAYLAGQESGGES